jgi:hypothetical protein
VRWVPKAQEAHIILPIARVPPIFENGSQKQSSGIVAVVVAVVVAVAVAVYPEGVKD